MIGRMGYYTTAAALAVLFLFPLVWSGWSSVKGQPGSSQSSGYGFANYDRMIHFDEGLGTYALNSAIVSVITVAGTLLVSSLGGYAFARFAFPGKNLLFIATLAILMVPYATILIPLYVFLGYLHLQNTLVGLALVFVMFQLPFATFMMRNSFDAVPPGLITVGLFAFLASWNDFFAPLILLNDGAKFTLPVAVFSVTNRTFGAIDYGMLESGVVIMALPCLILFLLLQRYYVRGFMSG